MSPTGPSDDSGINDLLIRMARTGRASNYDLDILVKHIRLFKQDRMIIPKIQEWRRCQSES